MLPLVTDTVRVAEAVRRAGMSRFESWCRANPAAAEPFRRDDVPDRFASPILSGKLACGRRRPDHDHAHYLPTADGDDPRRISHVTVFAAAGFGPAEVAALTRLRHLRLGDGDPLCVQLVGLGQPGDFRHWLFQPAAVWTSVTPFVAHRHLKTRGRKRDTPHLHGPDPRAAFVALAAREWVERRGLGRLRAVGPEAVGAGGPPPREFRRQRDRAGDDGGRRPFGVLRLTFAEPVSGPLCLGYACHFGLGLFRPADAPGA